MPGKKRITPEVVEVKGIDQIYPQLLIPKNLESFINRHSNRVVAVEDLMSKVRAAVGLGIDAAVMARHFPEIYRFGVPHGKQLDGTYDLFAADLGIEPTEKGNALLITGGSYVFNSMPWRLAGKVVHEINRLLREREDKKYHRESWKGVDWEWYGTQLPPKNKLNLRKVKRRK